MAEVRVVEIRSTCREVRWMGANRQERWLRYVLVAGEWVYVACGVEASTPRV